MSELHPLVGEFEFSNLGRSKACFKRKLTGERDLWNAVKPHFMSSDIEYEYDAEARTGKIFVGGFREVGQFKLVTA